MWWGTHDLNHLVLIYPAETLCSPSCAPRVLWMACGWPLPPHCGASVSLLIRVRQSHVPGGGGRGERRQLPRTSS